MKPFFKIILTCCIFFTAALQATGISPLLFKNVNQCFKPGFEYNSPIFGSIALSTGLIENLRFYNVEAFYDANGTREYIKDKPVQNDPIMNIVRILFPSPTGQIATSTEATNNAGKKTSFGWHCQSDPTKAAALLNFTHAVRAWFATKKPTDKLPKTVDKILTKIDPNKVIESVFPKNNFKPTELNPLLTSLAQAIELEIAPPKKSFKPSFYPKYFVEQIITAFFCYSFAKQEDLKAFLGALNNDITDANKINAIDGEIKEDDITAVIAKLDNQNSVTLDDIWALLNQKAFGRILPYENGKNPISNASAKMYQRSTNTVSNNKTFADCIEVALRHIVNFMLYDPNTDSFNLDALKAYMQGKNNPYIQNLYDFYTKQAPSAANAGDPNIRAAWNKVIADLDNGIHYRQKVDASDPQPNNELDTGMINVMRVFNTIFSLELPAEPVYQAGNYDGFKEEVQQWVKSGLTKLFNILNPNLKSSIAFDTIAINNQNLIGNINVNIKNNAENFLFSFTTRVLSNHIDIKNMKIFEGGKFALSDEHLDILQNKIKNLDSKAPASESSTYSSLFLLNSLIKSHDITNQLCHAYKLLSNIINDATSMVNTLQIMQQIISGTPAERTRPQVITILTNILHNYPWQDKASIEQIQDTILNLDTVDDIFTQVLRNGVKGFILKKDVNLAYLNDFKNIVYLFTHSGTLSSIILPDFMNELRVLDVQNSSIVELKLASCPKLRTINLSNADCLKKITFTHTLGELEEFSLDNGIITELDLSSCPQLRSIYLRQNKELRTITFPHVLDNLENFSLITSSVTELTLPSCPQLKNLNLSFTRNLEKITFSGPMNNLKEIDLYESATKEIIGTNFCTNLDISNISKDIKLIRTDDSSH